MAINYGKTRKNALEVINTIPEGGSVFIPLTDTVFLNPEEQGTDIDYKSPFLGSKRSFNDPLDTGASFSLNTSFLGNTQKYDSANDPDAEVSIFHDLFLMSGLKLDTLDSTNRIVKYTPNSDVTDGTQLNVYTEGLKKSLTGTAANITISGNVGELLKIGLEAKGFMLDFEPVLEDPNYTMLDSENYFLINKVTAVTIGGDIIDCESFTFNMNASVSKIKNTNNYTYMISDFDPQLQIVYLPIKNTFMNWTDFKNSAVKSISIECVSRLGDKTLKIDVPAGKIISTNDGESEGLSQVDTTYRCQNVNGDDNITITMTY